VSAAELDDATIEAWTARTRAACGLPPKITDPATLNRIITLAFEGRPTPGSQDEGGADPEAAE